MEVNLDLEVIAENIVNKALRGLSPSTRAATFPSNPTLGEFCVSGMCIAYLRGTVEMRRCCAGQK